MVNLEDIKKVLGMGSSAVDDRLGPICVENLTDILVQLREMKKETSFYRDVYTGLKQSIEIAYQIGDESQGQQPDQSATFFDKEKQKWSNYGFSSEVFTSLERLHHSVYDLGRRKRRKSLKLILDTIPQS
jgi:hypothetical protein